MQRLIKSILASNYLLSTTSIIVTLILLLLPSATTSKNTVEIPFLDKIVHSLLFMACSFFIIFDYFAKAKKKASVLHYCFIVIALVIMGVFTEFMQHYFLNRDGNVLDVIADLVGVILGLLLAHFFGDMLNQKLTIWKT